MSKQILNPEVAFRLIIECCIAKADSRKASAMEAYMKNKFTFYGIPAPQRKLISKRIKNTFLISDTCALWKLIEMLWQDAHRECQYIAIDLLSSCVKKLELKDVAKLEILVLDKSWWDTVDALAANLIGPIFRSHPAEFKLKALEWSDMDNIWIIRTSIIAQLKFGKLTHWDLLQQIILKHADSKEFFIRKAQGWALRQFAKFDAQSVLEFVNGHNDLSGLTKKEALKGLTALNVS